MKAGILPFHASFGCEGGHPDKVMGLYHGVWAHFFPVVARATG